MKIIIKNEIKSSKKANVEEETGDRTVKNTDKSIKMGFEASLKHNGMVVKLPRIK